MAKPAPAEHEGRITHATAGRINVERGENSVVLRLWQYSLSPVAVLTHREAALLMENIAKALKPPRTKIVEAEDYDDIA